MMSLVKAFGSVVARKDHPTLESIAEQSVSTCAKSRLDRSNYRELREIECDSTGTTLILRGRVSSFYMKQMAQTLVHNLEGVHKIINRLDVVYP